MYIAQRMEINEKDGAFFTKQLMQWHSTDNDRSLPWKEEQDPYKIWLSEIILQQTRSEQGVPYYLRFTEAYPTITDLAKAEDEEVFRLWQGLGYYNRCKNMLFTARFIAKEYDGVFPNQHEQIVALKGIGAYTAAAIASFAYGLPHAVVDGNVYRVLSRYFGINTPIDTTIGKKLFASIADQLLEKRDSAGYNQAIMDMGATVCTPKSPKCNECAVASRCVALKQDMIGLLPVKSKKLKVKNRFFHYILFLKEGKLWLRKRTSKDVWQNLYEPYLVEHNAIMDRSGLASKIEGIRKTDLSYEGSLKQRLTHQLLEIHFFECNSADGVTLPEGGVWVDIDALEQLAFPKSIVSFLEKKLYI